MLLISKLSGIFDSETNQKPGIPAKEGDNSMFTTKNTTSQLQAKISRYDMEEIEQL